MKTIKITFLLAATLMIGNIVSAQTTFGVRAGVNFQNLNGKQSDGDKIMGKIRTGFNAGVNAEIPIGEGFYLQPGILYSLKGANEKDFEMVETSISYIEVPINFIYKPDLGTGRMLLGFGPYVAYGIGGKVENAGIENDVKFEKEAGNAANTVYFKPLDAGANILFGYEFSNKLSAQLNAQLGLVNINAYDNDAKLKNTGFGV